MPTSIDPPLADDEIECGRCGAHIYYELTRCPNCGVNLYEPDDDDDQSRPATLHKKGLRDRLGGFVRKLTKQPYPADELFGAAINLAGAFDNLLTKVGGDRLAAERLIEFERQHFPQGNRIIWLQNAIRRWEQDNKGFGVK